MRPKSKQPRKQRNYQFNLEKKEVHKVLSVHLSPELRANKGFRSLPVRVGDSITVMRGSMKGRTGKVSRVDPKNQRIFIDKAVKRKTDNTEIPVPIHPSNCMITKYTEKHGRSVDTHRLEAINRRIKSEDQKIDIESVVSALEEDDDEVLEIDDEEITDGDSSTDDDIELVEAENEEETS